MLIINKIIIKFIFFYFRFKQKITTYISNNICGDFFKTTKIKKLKKINKKEDKQKILKIIFDLSAHSQ